MKYLFLIIFIIFLSCCKSTDKISYDLNHNDTTTLKNNSKTLEDSVSKSIDSVYYEEQVVVGLPLQSIPKKKLAKKEVVKKEVTVVDYENITEGNITYYIPDSMITNKTYRIYMVLSAPQKKLKLIIMNQKNPYETIDSNKIVIDKVKLGNTMNATLLDPTKSFNITPIGDETKVLDTAKSEKWLWDIVPLKEGSFPLILKVEIVTDKDGKERKTNLEVFNKQLIIKAEKIPIYIKILNFISNNWEFFVSSLIIPFGIWLYNNRKKKKNNI